jgi:hypothetical protein
MPALASMLKNLRRRRPLIQSHDIELTRRFQSLSCWQGHAAQDVHGRAPAIQKALAIVGFANKCFWFGHGPNSVFAERDRENETSRSALRSDMNRQAGAQGRLVTLHLIN